MKNLKQLKIMVFLLIANFSFAQTYFCPGNLIQNGDLEIVTPTIWDQDIDNALGFSRICPSGSNADFYTFNTGSHPTPIPQGGNYAALWISNVTGNTIYREGLMTALPSQILAGTGSYTLNFDLGCLNRGTGNGHVQIVIYGVYNPSGSLGAQPTDMFTPSNMDIFPGQTTLDTKIDTL